MQKKCQTTDVSDIFYYAFLNLITAGFSFVRIMLNQQHERLHGGSFFAVN